MKAFFLTTCILFLLNCFNNNDLKIKGKYCSQEGNNNEFTVMFIVESETVKLRYFNIIDNGNYINGFDDSLDFAGQFLLNDVSNSEVNVKVRNYRDSNDVYMVLIKFLDDGNSLIWEVEENVVAYLPKHTKLTTCK